MRRPALHAALACLCAAILATACSDAPKTSATGSGVADTKGADTGINLGDIKTADSGKNEVSSEVSAEVSTEDVIADTIDDTQIGSDTELTGCTTDDDCEGKVNDLAICQVAGCDTATGTCGAKTAADGKACVATDLCFSDSACSAGQCLGAKAVACDDHEVCTDDSCDPTQGCQFTNNTKPCDDGDALTTGDLCAAGKCTPGTGTCAYPKELNCTDGKDEDCDTFTDCADNECAADEACKNVKPETDCGNKVDDDGDGSTDCTDSDCVADATCMPPAKETACADKIDEDKDGGTDCADNDCNNDPICATPIKEANCTDKIDEDKDGATDCADPDCAADVACKVVASETDCQNKLDDDKDNAVDCADNDCAAELACVVTVETGCGNAVDDDKDGKIDCADTDCAKDPVCTAPKTETNCTDKLDDDKDGLVDCNDADCAANAACKATCNVCAPDTAKKPLDAKCDPCAAAVCKADAYCCSTSWDATCVKEVNQYCGKQCEAVCGNKLDDDKDNQTDCADADCAKDALCLPVAVTTCAADYALTCGSSDNFNNGGDGSTKAIDTYKCTDGEASQETGSEFTYDLTSDCDGTLTVSLQKSSTKAGFLDLFLLDGAKVCAGSSCLAHGKMAGAAATASVQATKGQKFRVVVDGFAGFADDFSIKVACGCAGGKETDCKDKVDNDVDGKVDCLDADCAANLACAPTAETKCADKLDDDKDGKTDCADSDCVKDSACVVVLESNCTDTVDNDKDGKTDCSDADCAAALACATTTTEGNCTDKIDNDKDGKTDCTDTDCAKNVACLPPVETLCADKLDNDKDGKIDCADVDCSGTSACQCKADYDLGPGVTDNWNNGAAGSTKVVSDYVCPDGNASNETGPEYTYTFVSDCQGELTVTLSKTTSSNGYLDLFLLDGTKPCAGNSCIGHALMGTTTAVKKLNVIVGQKLLVVVDGYQAFAGDYSIKTTCAVKEVNCTNKIDDDKDGKIDCTDADCVADSACKLPPEANCTDKIDNDKDGKTDCTDTDCAANTACKTPTTEVSCTDKVDNDKDGKTDCTDTDCAADLACKTPTTEGTCDDKLDNDKDGKTDCADTDCAGKPACSCVVDYPLTCGGGDTFGNSNPGSTDVVNDYQCKDGAVSNETGNEYTYGYVATCTGDVTVTLTKTSTTNGYLDLFVLDGAKACGGAGCTAHALMSGSTATLKFAAVLGAKYDIVVDGYNNYAGNYSVKVACGCAPTTEANCTNKLDDDKDGKIDCADSDCATNVACVPKEANCTDKLDNDKDGKIDCADTDCATNAACVTCKDDLPLTCGDSDKWTNNGFGSTKAADNYTCADAPGQVVNGETGSEYTYELTASCTGKATVTLTKTTGKATDYLDLFILDGSKACSPSTCTVHNLMDKGVAKVTFPVTKDQKFHVVVDGYSAFSGGYTIATSCSCQ